ncbi:MAG: hypothetical protein DSM107014_01995 [Gomphosphaeria aponina SAG 52.96 = DSM 107014]|uniref:Uncharacterized protein n=1 Tax=Gomphosphaeria aponina SAG 52.96 = DSM 107014 TaxID=1521640 RepID=A0A941GMZ5_9CHRO|nr:hypothetical protein [Gomphosphaeria aponina SAG 52.96 = DSM 107014]
MPEYTLTITIPSAGNRKINYTLNLIGTHERYPEDFFRVQENRNHLSQTIQQQSARQLDKNQLNRIISDWTRDIKEGYRNTVITLNLAPDTLTSPTLSHPVTPNPPIAIPKQPIKPLPTNPQTVNYPTSPDPWSTNEPPSPLPPRPIVIQKNPTPPPPPEEEEETPPPDIRKAGNKYDDF